MPYLFFYLGREGVLVNGSRADAKPHRGDPSEALSAAACRG